MIVGNSNNVTASDTTSAQPTRRARFKPKVGIVAPAQRSQGKTTNQQKVSTEVPVNATKSPGTQTASTPVAGSRISHASPKQPGSSPVNKDGQTTAGTSKITVTATVHRSPLTGQQPNGSRTKQSNENSPIPTSRQNDTAPGSGGSQILSGNKTSTLPVTRDVGGRPPSTTRLPTDGSKAPASKDTDCQPSSSHQTVTINNSASVNQPSNGNQVNTVVCSDQLLTQANEDAASAKDNGTTLNCSGTNTQKTSSFQNSTTPNHTATVKPARRSRIKPKVGMASTKTPAQKSANKAPVQKTTISEQTHAQPASPTVSTHLDTANCETSTSAGNETRTVKASPVTNTDDQASADTTPVTKTSTKDATGPVETINTPRKEPIQQSALTRRARVTPNVRGKPSKAPAQKTVSDNQNSEVQPSITTPSDNQSGSNSLLSTGAANINQSTSSGVKDANNISSTLSKNVDVTAVESNLSSTSKESENITFANSENLTSQSQSSANNESTNASNKERPKTNIAAQNLAISTSKQTTATPEPTQPTRRARFKPRVAVIGRPGAQPQKNQNKMNAVSKPPASSGSIARSKTDSVLNETRNAQQNAVSRLNANVENRQPETGNIVAPGNENAKGNPSAETENLSSATNENGKDAEQEILQQASSTSRNVTSENIQHKCHQTTGQVNQSISLAGKGVSDKRPQTVPTVSINSTSEQTETCSEVILSSDPKTSQESLQDVILSQDDENSSRNVDSSSPSCLPVMMDDQSILPPSDVTLDRLPPGVDYPPELPPQTTTVDNMDDDLPNLYHLETAEDLLQTLLNEASRAINYPPQQKSGVVNDTSGIANDMNRIPMDMTQNVNADPNISIPTPLSSTMLRNQTETSLNTSGTLPQSNQAKSTLSNRQGTIVGNQAAPNIQAAPVSQAASNSQDVPNSPAATTSRLVVKRQRRRPKNKQSLPFETSFLDISTIPIASNIEIEPEIQENEDIIDHPVLEIPVDLIQDDLPQSSPTARTSSRGLKQRFQQRRSGAVKLVLSRKRSENSDVDKEDTRSASGGTSSTPGDRSSTPGDTRSTSGDRSTTPVDRSCTSGRTSSIREDTTDNTSIDVRGSSVSASNVETQKSSRGIIRKVRPTPNIQIRRRTSKARSQENAAAVERRIPPGLTQNNASTALTVSDTTPGQEKDTVIEKQSSVATNASEKVVDISESSNSVDVSNNTVCDNSTSIFGLDTSTAGLGPERTADNNSSVVPGDDQSEIERRDDCLAISNSARNNESSTIQGNSASEDHESHSCVDGANVHDLSKDDEIEIVLEVIGTGQGYTDVVCGSASAVSDETDVGVNQTVATEASVNSEIENESGSERTTVQTNVDGGYETCTSSLQQSSGLGHSPKSIAGANISGGTQGIVYSNDIANDNQGNKSLQSGDEVTGTAEQNLCISVSESLVNGQDTSSDKPEKSTNDGQTIALPNSSIRNSLTVNSGAEDVRIDPTSSNLPSDTTAENLSVYRRLTSQKNPNVLSDPNSSTPLHDVSSDEPEGALGLASDIEFSDSQTNMATEDVNPMSSPAIQDISLNIPEAVIASSNDPLSNIVECSECPEVELCLTTIDTTSIDHQADSLSQTQPGTLEDTVARATRRASEEFDAQQLTNSTGGEKIQTASEKTANGETTTALNEKEIEKRALGEKTSVSKQKEKTTRQATSAADNNEKESGKQLSGKGRSRQKPKPNLQRKRKARGKIVDNDESDGTTGGNNEAVVQEEATPEGTAVQDSSLDSSCAHEDGSLRDTCVQVDTTEGGDGAEVSPEGSTPEVPGDPVQNESSKKSGARKRQSKAVKPKIPAKRGRKKAAAAQETENVDSREQAENPVSIVH